MRLSHVANVEASPTIHCEPSPEAIDLCWALLIFEPSKTRAKKICYIFTCEQKHLGFFLGGWRMPYYHHTTQTNMNKHPKAAKQSENVASPFSSRSWSKPVAANFAKGKTKLQHAIRYWSWSARSTNISEFTAFLDLSIVRSMLAILSSSSSPPR